MHSHSNPAHPMGADQLGPGQRGANQTGAAQVGSGQVCAAQVEVGQMVANQLGAGCWVPARRVPARCVPAIWELSRAHVRHLTRALGGSLKVPRTRLFPRSTWDEVVKTCRRPRRQRGRHPLLTCCRHGGCPVRRLVVPGARLQHGHPCGHQLGRGHLLFSYNVATSAWDQLFHRSAVGWGRVLLHSRLNPHHPRVVVLTAAALSAAAVDLLSARWGPRPPLVVRGTYSWGGGTACRFRSGAGGECFCIRAPFPTTPGWFMLTAAARSASAVDLLPVWWGPCPPLGGQGCPLPWVAVARAIGLSGVGGGCFCIRTPILPTQWVLIN